MGHSDVLNQLLPFEFGGDSPAENAVDGVVLDVLETCAASLLSEMHGDTATVAGLLADHERLFGIRVAVGASLADRQARVASRRAERGGLSIPYYIGIAAALGYTITISEGDDNVVPFRAGISAAGDAVFTFTERWTWTVTVHGINGTPGAPALEVLLQDLRPAWTTLDFAYST